MAVTQRQERQISRPLYRFSQFTLMGGTGSGDSPWNDLSPLGNEVTERSGILVIYFCRVIRTELAELAPGIKFTSSARPLLRSGTRIWP